MFYFNSGNCRSIDQKFDYEANLESYLSVEDHLNINESKVSIDEIFILVDEHAFS